MTFSIALAPSHLASPATDGGVNTSANISCSNFSNPRQHRFKTTDVSVTTITAERFSRACPCPPRTSLRCSSGFGGGSALFPVLTFAAQGGAKRVRPAHEVPMGRADASVHWPAMDIGGHVPPLLVRNSFRRPQPRRGETRSPAHEVPMGRADAPVHWPAMDIGGHVPPLLVRSRSAARGPRRGDTRSPADEGQWEERTRRFIGPPSASADTFRRSLCGTRSAARARRGDACSPAHEVPMGRAKRRFIGFPSASADTFRRSLCGTRSAARGPRRGETRSPAHEVPMGRADAPVHWPAMGIGGHVPPLLVRNPFRRPQPKEGRNAFARP